MKRYLLFPYPFIVICIIIFFSPFIFQGKLPIPSDTIVGLYHPFRDLYAKEYPRGIPFKNFLITDPVRQQYPWRTLSIDLLRKFDLPLWNPYNLAGTPLLGNFQSAGFYPLNVLYFFISFRYAWSLLVLIQPLLSGIFLYMYMRNLRINHWAAYLSALAYAFSGFNIAWLEWNTVGHTGLWLPLVLLSIDKIIANAVSNKSVKLISNIKYKISNIYIKDKILIFWSVVYIFSLTSSFFAGHLQTFFYLFLIQIIYSILRWLQNGKNKKLLLLFIIHHSFFTILTAIQWIPALQLIGLSARSIDLDWQRTGWFIPWQHLLQFIIPDFFGNPATLNYWGVWNYAEFIGYIGVIPLMMAIYALFSRFDRKTLFFGILFFLSLLFALPTQFAKLPYLLKIPFLSSSQPTRLLFLTDFSLAVLSGLGLDYYLKNKRNIYTVFIFLGLIYTTVWLFLIKGGGLFNISADNLAVAKRNTYLPFIFFISAILVLSLQKLFSKKYQNAAVILLLVITIFDLIRFGKKFTPFTVTEYLFPHTATISFLQKNSGVSRIMSMDDRILPPNFSLFYKLQSVDGYDPLYLLRYGELIAASERNKPDIKPPFGFNRIITPKNLNSRIINLLGVKYVLSLSELSSPDLVKVFQEGETQVYENLSVLPRVFFVENTIFAQNNQMAIELLLNPEFDIKRKAIIEYVNPEKRQLVRHWAEGFAKILEYTENKVVIETNVNALKNRDEGFLILTDSFYPTWQVKIWKHGIADPEKETIYRTNYNFRGVIVPVGKSKVEFYNTLIPPSNI